MTSLDWWTSYNKGIRNLQRKNAAGCASTLSFEICSLLDDVDQAYHLLAADSSTRSDSAATRRARAWCTVAVNRGWAQLDDDAFEGHRQEISLIPFAKDAFPLLFQITNADFGRIDCGVTAFAIIDQTKIQLVHVQESRNMQTFAEEIEDLDKWVFSILDGSFMIESAQTYFTVSTSFMSETTKSRHRQLGLGQYIARPWMHGWESRSITKP
ncbi:hypothetical protein [Rhodococcus sp. NBC_00294]|uniref:hypothetical protein n=1 Tax=Rhodococcus sp. NBC_00294 TaxID=2976004 RepID=UPI002E2CF6C5|nr:hypothetical protein [Rhodococcus sp. NBC_00294]